MKLQILVVAALAVGLANAQFKCEVAGRFLDKLSNCTQYFDCQRNATSELILTHMTCPIQRLFSVDEQRCVMASNLMCRLLTDGTTTSMPVWSDAPTTSRPIHVIGESLVNQTLSESNTTFVCSSLGRYPTTSPGCRQYINCQLQSRNILQTLETCPEATVFSPEQLLCVPPSSYKCPNPATGINN